MKRLPLAVLIFAFCVFLAWSVALRQALLFLVGIGLGAVLAGARFGSELPDPRPAPRIEDIHLRAPRVELPSAIEPHSFAVCRVPERVNRTDRCFHR